MKAQITELPNLLDSDVERVTGGILKAKTLRHWRLVGGGPKYFKIGRRCLYRNTDIETFILSDERGVIDESPGDAAASTGADGQIFTNSITLADLISRTRLSDVIREFWGVEVKGGRCAAGYRGGDNPGAVSVDDEKSVYFDNVVGEGGGILAAIQAPSGCDRKRAVELLANYHGARLDRQTPAQATEWRRRRSVAQRQAAELADWRQSERRRLIEQRNHLHDTANCAMACGRLLLREGDAAPESAWDLVWSHALDDLRGDDVQGRLDALEAMTPGELAAYRARAEAVAA